MPRNNGIYSPPPGTGGAPQTTISSAMFNAFVADIAADQNNARPVIAGGTGAATAAGALQNLGGISTATIHAADDKTTPVDADELPLVDSAASWSLKKLTWASIKAALASAFMTISGASQTITGHKRFSSSLTGISQATGAGTMFEAFAGGTQAAAIAFHRSGVHAAYFGLDTDNRLKFGGWSLGANAYEVWHHGRVNAAGWAVPTAPTASGHVATKQYVDGIALGVGQTWQDVSGSRLAQTSYQNTTGKPIMVSIRTNGGSSGSLEYQVSPNGSTWIAVGAIVTSGRQLQTFIVPPGWWYRQGSNGAIEYWAELR